MSSFIGFIKSVNVFRKWVESFIKLWVRYDIERIKTNYDEHTKEHVEILEAIKRAKDRNDKEAIKHLMRQRHLIGVPNSRVSEAKRARVQDRR